MTIQGYDLVGDIHGSSQALGDRHPRRLLLGRHHRPSLRLRQRPAKPTLPKPTVLTSTGPAKNATDYSRAPMTEAEKVNFHSGAVRRGKLFAELEPVVTAYAREQTRKPAEASLRLNADGHAPAVGAAWTPRLVHFLLALMFNDPKPDGKPDRR
jgi:hypothetical protein